MSVETFVSQSFAVSGKNAVVTGAGSGIGKSIARTLAAAGARVVLADLNPDSASAVADAINSDAGQVLAYPVEVDIGSEESIVRLFNRAVEILGRIDILVNNAGIYQKTHFLETSAEKWDLLHRVNLRGTFICMRECIKQMKEAGAGGAIVNISSVASLQAVIYDNGDYGASKAGINNLTKTAALEFAADSIRVNAVLPGGVETEGAARETAHVVVRGPMTNPERMPLGRLARPEEIAAAVLFLASPAASYITGQLLAVDGGFQAS